MCLIQDISSHVFLLAFLICRSIGAGLGSEPHTGCTRDQQKGRASQLTVILPRCFALVFSYEIYWHEAFFFSFCAFVTWFPLLPPNMYPVMSPSIAAQLHLLESGNVRRGLCFTLLSALLLLPEHFFIFSRERSTLEQLLCLRCFHIPRNSIAKDKMVFSFKLL